MKKGIGTRGIRIIEAMIDNHMLPNRIESIDAQYNEMLKWNDAALSAAERLLKIPVPQKAKVGEDKSDKQMVGKLSEKDRKWAVGVANKFEANPEIYNPKWLKKKVGS